MRAAVGQKEFTCELPYVCAKAQIILPTCRCLLLPVLVNRVGGHDRANGVTDDAGGGKAPHRSEILKGREGPRAAHMRTLDYY